MSIHINPISSIDSPVKLFDSEKNQIDVVVTCIYRDKKYINYHVFRATDTEKTSPIGFMNMEVKKNCLWIHTMGSDTVRGVGKALIEKAKEECRSHKKPEIRLKAIGTSHCFYHSCKFVPVATTKVDAVATKAIGERIASATAAAKKEGKRAETRFDPLKMGLVVD